MNIELNIRENCPCEIWVNEYPEGFAVAHESRENADKKAVDGRISLVRFREVERFEKDELR